MSDIYTPAHELTLGMRLNARIPEADQKRQRMEVMEILGRLRVQPGVILADEVGMGKTFVALAVAYSVAMHNSRGPVIIMVPANLMDKWEQDLFTFCELYLEKHHPVKWDGAALRNLKDPEAVRYDVTHHSIDLLKCLDDPPSIRCHIVFLAQGAMGRSQTDKWVRLALIAEALRRHGRGGKSRLSQVRRQIHRFLARLISAVGEERLFVSGDELWIQLLRSDPREWKGIYNKAVQDRTSRLSDDPVPASVRRVLKRVDLSELAAALKEMPVRARGGDERILERIKRVRSVLRGIEQELWRHILAQALWRSPLLVMDEAHHLKNPGTSLARQLQSVDSDRDLRTGDGAMTKAFDRMLFLTATPFQLGHHELVNVLDNFGNIRWNEDELGPLERFKEHMKALHDRLGDSQRTAISLQRSWSRLQTGDCGDDIDAWWSGLRALPREKLIYRQRAVLDSYASAKSCRDATEDSLRPWIVRENKGMHWVGTGIKRRCVVTGANVADTAASGGLPVPPQELLPFFLAARSAANPGKDLLGEALCSSYEAFRRTRNGHDPEKDDQDEPSVAHVDHSHSQWYLHEFDRALRKCSGLAHPKVGVTVRKAVDLWEAGEKVLVFAFYRRTCGSLRVHISQEMQRRIMSAGQRKLLEAGQKGGKEDLERLLDRIQNRYFDVKSSPGRRSMDGALREIIQQYSKEIGESRMTEPQRKTLLDVMRRFMRAQSTLVRSFPIAELDSIKPDEAVFKTLNHRDGSGVSWREKFSTFIEFITKDCSSDERRKYLEAAYQGQTGGIRVEDVDDPDNGGKSGIVTLPNVQTATGKTQRNARVRLMHNFNTPFFPDILVCSQVMGEGVDLQRFCRHVIHHDLAWNPSTIEQRTGRLDRLGCKAEGRHPINVYLPYLVGAADERQYRVMSDRERWFRVVMGEDEVARLITEDSTSAVPLPEAIAGELNFKLSVVAI